MVAGLKDAGEDHREVMISLSLSPPLSFIDCNDTGYATKQTATAILLLVCHVANDIIHN